MPEKAKKEFDLEDKQESPEGKYEELFELLSPGKSIDFRIEQAMQNLPNQFVVLFLEKIREYSHVNIRLINFFSKRNIPGVYVGVNKPLHSLIDTLNRQKIGYNHIYFIDGITTITGNTPVKNPNFFYVESPKNLIALSVAIETCMQKIKAPQKFLVFDSLSTMLVYNKTTVVEKFAHSIAGKIRAWKAKGVLLMVESKQEEIMRTISQFCDETIEL